MQSYIRGGPYEIADVAAVDDMAIRPRVVLVVPVPSQSEAKVFTASLTGQQTKIIDKNESEDSQSNA